MLESISLVEKNTENIEGILRILQAHRELINSLIKVNKIQQNNIENLMDIVKMKNGKSGK